jgi:hypothetical protein
MNICEIKVKLNRMLIELSLINPNNDINGGENSRE